MLENIWCYVFAGCWRVPMTALLRSRPCLSSSPPAALTQSPAPPPGRLVCGSQVTRRMKYFSNMRKYFYFCKYIFVADQLVSMIALVGLDCQVARLRLAAGNPVKTLILWPIFGWFSAEFSALQVTESEKCKTHILHFTHVTRSQISRRQHRSQHNSIIHANKPFFTFHLHHPRTRFL